MVIKCSKCNNTIGRTHNYLSCKACRSYFHLECANVSKEGDQFKLATRARLSSWKCSFCSILPEADEASAVYSVNLLTDALKNICSIVQQQLKLRVDIISEFKGNM